MMCSSVRAGWRSVLVVGFVLGLSACARNPAAPTSANLLSDGTALAARPSPQPPVPVQISFSGDVSGGGSASAVISGDAGGGNLKVTATAAAYVLTINTVRIQENAPLQCTTDDQQALVFYGLQGQPLTGDLSLTIDQTDDPPMVTFKLSNVTAGGKTWEVGSSSSNNYPAVHFAGSATAGTASADQQFGKLGVSEQVKGNKGIGISCRGTYSVSVVRQQQ